MTQKEGVTMNCTMIGAASDLGVSRDGTAQSPEVLREHCFPNVPFKMICAPETIKSRSAQDLRKNEAEINILDKELYDAFLKAKQDGDFTILVGGDHTCAIPSALSSCEAYGKTGVLWIDAHTDFNTFRTTETGNIHGLPLACISGYECEELRTFHTGDTVDPANVCVVGARSIDREEKENLKDAGVRVISTDEIHERGIEAVMEEAFAVCLAGTGKVHVSFDLDVIDPSEAPGVTVPEVCGISSGEALRINSIVAKRISDVCSYDLVELNPSNDIDRKTEQIACTLLKQILEAVQSK